VACASHARLVRFHQDREWNDVPNIYGGVIVKRRRDVEVDADWSKMVLARWGI
jgi:hypothetical protein